MRLRRRGLASINSEIRDGILPAGEAIGRVARDDGVAGRAPAGYRVTALIIACALFMEQLDATVLSTALPTMARDFGVPATDMSSALTSYLLALAIFIPASGRLADRFGSRTVFRAAILIFVAGSALCGVAPDLPVIMAARFVQGLGGAMMIPIGRLVLLRSVAKEDIVAAMSWLIIPALLGPVLGPPIGGAIVTYLNWRWIFYVNLPIGLIGIVLVTRYIAEVRVEVPARFDAWGFLLSGVALGCLLFGFEMTSRSDGLRQGLVLIGVGAVASATYLRHARRRADPILDVTLMRVPTFRLSVIAGSLTRITQGAQPFLLPMMLQLGFGMTAAASGAITLAGAVGSLVMKGLAPRVLRRWGFRRSLIVGGLGGSAGYAACALFRPGWPVPAIFAVLMAGGFFMSFQFSAYNTIAYDEIPAERMSSANSFYSTFQQLTLSLGICVAAASLRLGMLGSGDVQPRLADFTLAFLVVTAISASATWWNGRFAADAGAQMSGHRG